RCVRWVRRADASLENGEDKFSTGSTRPPDPPRGTPDLRHRHAPPGSHRFVGGRGGRFPRAESRQHAGHRDPEDRRHAHHPRRRAPEGADRKSTRLNSSHVSISYAVFCLKKKKKKKKKKRTKKKKKKKKKNNKKNNEI